MTSQLTVITGASRGMGLELALQLLQPAQQLLCISRQTSQILERAAKAAGVPLVQWQLDLADSEAACTRLTSWLRDQPSNRFSRAALINNAGVIPPIVPLSQSSPRDLSIALRVGLEAPLLLTATFLRWPENWSAQRRVLNISSGLGRRAMASQAGYCAARPEWITSAVAWPWTSAKAARRQGVLAGAGRDRHRHASAIAQRRCSAFPERDNFAVLKDKGLLASPADAAARVLAYLARADFGENPVADVRDA